MLLATITTWIGNIPPIAIAVLIVLIYVYIAGGRWTWAMMPDAGLLALYLWRPNLGMLTFALVLGTVRHVPALAREVVVLFRLHEFDGWTIRMVLFALPALHAYTTASQPRAAADRPGAVGITITMPPPVEVKSPAPDSPPIECRALAPAAWLGEINDNATKPMLGIVGATQLGKSTLALAALGRRAGKVVIATPKSSEEDPWNGAKAHRLQIDLTTRRVDWSPIIHAIDAVHYEMLRRKAMGDTKSEQLTLVIDEYNQLLRNAPKQTRDQVIAMWGMAASSRIRVIVIATEVNARGWGIEGQRDLLDNLTFMRVEDGRRWSIGRLDANGRLIDPQACDTLPLRQLAREAQLSGREWIPPPMPGAAPADQGLIGDLLGALHPVGAGVGVPAGGVGGDTPPDPGVQTHTNAHTNAHAAEERIQLYMEWRKLDIKKEQARAFRNSMGAGIDDKEWAEAGKRLGV